MAKNHFTRFNEGVEISGVALNIHQKGRVYYVGNSTVLPPRAVAASDNNSGLAPEKPLSTITKALSLCTASRGDKIVLLPGHAETVSAAAGLDINVAGVSIIADPTAIGAQRPTITLDTANTATVRVSAADVSIRNVLFVANFLNIATCIVLTTATDLQVIDCEFRDTSAVLNFVKAVKTSVTDNQADGLTVSGCTMLGTGTSAATCLVNVLGAINRMSVIENRVDIQGTTATTGALVLATSKAMTGTLIKDNAVTSPLTTSAAGGLIVGGTGGSGVVRGNYLYIPAAATGILCTTGTGLGFINNYVTRSAVDTSGLLLPAAST